MENKLLQPYSLVSVCQFTEEQKLYIEELKRNISFISSQTNMVFGAKDINSRHILSTNAYAQLVGLEIGEEVVDRLDQDMPCEGTTQFADQFVQEDLSLITQSDIKKKMSTLNVHMYNDGLKALVFDKFILKHHPSKSILGLIYSAREMELNSFLTLIPNYVIEFGTSCSIESIQGDVAIDDIKLSEYEYEICFLLVMNWNFKQIAEFLNKYRPKPSKRTEDTIYKKRNRICEKLGLSGNNPAVLRDKLVSMKIHTRMPSTFFNRLLGSNRLH